MTKTPGVTYEEIEKKIKTYIKDKKKLNLVKQAYSFAKEKHENDQSLTGEPYIIHPLELANILTTINADAETITAALLHELIEDEKVTEAELLQNFNQEIVALINGLTQINRLNFKLDSPSLNANYRKIIVGLSKDVRVIILKLADRLHNMRTLWVLSEEEQKEVAKETKDILIPIAHRLGMHQIKSELEDLSLRYLKPDVYFSIVENLNKTKKERDEIVEQMIYEVSQLLQKHGIKNYVKGRAKSIYSIYSKLDQGRSFRDIYDLMALRVFVDSESECYQALGIIHSHYRSIPKRFKDFIAMPKANMYQSLHTTIFGLKDNMFEIQIRTPEMDEIAEKGIASHWSYKEGKQKLQSALEEKLQFFRSIIELQNQEAEDSAFVSLVREDFFDDTIYVFTPKGDVIELPEGATPIDFAYKVHSQVGDKMVSAIVNKSIVPLDYRLVNQDVVEIKTNANSVGPSREWLNIARTSQAKSKIKAYFNKIDKERYYEKGEELLAKELRNQKISNNEFFADENLKKVLKTLKLTNLEELYIALGSGKITVNQVISSLTTTPKEDIVPRKTTMHQPVKSSIKNEIIVEGMEDLKVNIAACCRPVYGDEIIGYITKGHGISVHRTNCPNIKDLNERIIDVYWNEDVTSHYLTTLIIYAFSDHNLLLDIMSKTANYDISVKHFNDLEKKENYVFELVVVVENVADLGKFISAIEQLKNINRVERLVK